MAIAKLILNGEVQMDVTSDTVSANRLLSGYTATKNDGTKVTGSYVPPSVTISALTVTPTENQQTFNAAAVSGYKPVTVNAISSTYVGSGIDRITSLPGIPVSYTYDSSRAQFHADTYSIGPGYISQAVTPNNSALTINLFSVSTVTPSSGSYTIYGTRLLSSKLTIEAIPSSYIIPSGTSNITSNGTYNIASYQSVSVDVAGGGGYTADDIATKNISGSIGGNASVIASYAFYWNKLITSVNFPEVKSIGLAAFQQCSSLQGLYFPLASYLGQQAFYQCSSLISIDFPKVEIIDYSCFYRCVNLRHISFPIASYINAQAFTDCSALTEVSFPSAKSIGQSAFNACINLETISFPLASIISASAFFSCPKISTIYFPSATTIGSYAFMRCAELTTASFPLASIISAGAFRSCFKLLSFYLLGSSIPSLPNTNAFSDTPIAGVTTSTGGVYGSIYVPASLFSSYIIKTGWATYSDRFVSV